MCVRACVCVCVCVCLLFVLQKFFAWKDKSQVSSHQRCAMLMFCARYMAMMYLCMFMSSI